jgi:hypothetical protein
MVGKGSDYLGLSRVLYQSHHKLMLLVHLYLKVKEDKSHELNNVFHVFPYVVPCWFGSFRS